LAFAGWHPQNLGAANTRCYIVEVAVQRQVCPVQLHLFHRHVQGFPQSVVIKMDSHIADDKLRELHIEDTTVKTNRDAMQYEIDPAAEKKLLRKIDLHVVPILWFLFM
jgi:hypothetical protein